MQIRTGDTFDPRVIALLDYHVTTARAQTAPGSATPFYESGGANLRGPTTTTMFDRPSAMDHLVRREFKKGADKVADEAIEKNEALINFLKQPTSEKSDYDKTIEQLGKLV